MFWPIVLPFQLTCLLVVIVTFAVTLVSPWRNRKRLPTFFVCAGLSLVLFVPACIGIATITDHFRFGRFTYSDFDQIDDFRVQRFMPPDAKNVDVEKYGSGFRARFEIVAADLDGWVDELWQRYGDSSVVERGNLDADPIESLEYTSRVFDGLSWAPGLGCEEISGPIAANGAGCTIWYDRQKEVAYERAGYW